MAAIFIVLIVMASLFALGMFFGVVGTLIDTSEMDDMLYWFPEIFIQVNIFGKIILTLTMGLSCLGLAAGFYLTVGLLWIMFH